MTSCEGIIHFTIARLSQGIVLPANTIQLWCFHCKQSMVDHYSSIRKKCLIGYFTFWNVQCFSLWTSAWFLSQENSVQSYSYKYEFHIYICLKKPSVSWLDAANDVLACFKVEPVKWIIYLKDVYWVLDKTIICTSLETCITTYIDHYFTRIGLIFAFQSFLHERERKEQVISRVLHDLDDLTFSVSS